MNLNFATWLSHFKTSIASYDYYVDYQKVYRNLASINDDLIKLNTLIGAKDIKNKFENLILAEPKLIECIPKLLAIRDKSINILADDGNMTNFSFKKLNNQIELYSVLMERSGLFDLMQNHLINNLVDYYIGVETGLDTNARKNRGGDLLENVIQNALEHYGFINGETYFKNMPVSEVEQLYNLNLENVSNRARSIKRFDFVVKTENCVYGIEANFYTSGGSILNETARTYRDLANNCNNIEGFKFIWFTDGKGWKNARRELERSYIAMNNIYNIHDLEEGLFETLLK